MTEYFVIANNRIMLRTPNRVLAIHMAASLCVHCIVENDQFELIAEYNV